MYGNDPSTFHTIDNLVLGSQGILLIPFWQFHEPQPMEIEAAAENGMGNLQLEDLRKLGFSKNNNTKKPEC